MKRSLVAIILNVFAINKHLTIYDGQVMIINGQLEWRGGGRRGGI
jgi:hypothetical protein